MQVILFKEHNFGWVLRINFGSFLEIINFQLFKWKFDVTGLQAEYKDNFLTPFVKESTIQIGVECKKK